MEMNKRVNSVAAVFLAAGMLFSVPAFAETDPATKMTAEEKAEAIKYMALRNCVQDGAASLQASAARGVYKNQQEVDDAVKKLVTGCEKEAVYDTGHAMAFESHLEKKYGSDEQINRVFENTFPELAQPQP
ncbi:MAG: hypothetical protein HY370_01835 [Proteobacteria bacterium]|nr:hypothetical protein [Pseudomonadota bacterium]